MHTPWRMYTEVRGHLPEVIFLLSQSRDWTLLISLGSKHFPPLSHLIGPGCGLLRLKMHSSSNTSKNEAGISSNTQSQQITLAPSLEINVPELPKRKRRKILEKKFKLTFFKEMNTIKRSISDTECLLQVWSNVSAFIRFMEYVNRKLANCIFPIFFSFNTI